MYYLRLIIARAHSAIGLGKQIYEPIQPQRKVDHQAVIFFHQLNAYLLLLHEPTSIIASIFSLSFAAFEYATMDTTSDSRMPAQPAANPEAENVAVVAQVLKKGHTENDGLMEAAECRRDTSEKVKKVTKASLRNYFVSNSLGCVYC